MFAVLQSLAISLQQSISAAVSGWSGIKHASWGASPQASRRPKTNVRNGHDMCKVYIGVSQSDVSGRRRCLRPENSSTFERRIKQTIHLKHVVEFVVLS
jgi:hypothetical protein